MNDMSILVCSCDKYEDVWNPMFEMFYKFWPDCEQNVYLLTNEKEFKHDKVKTIKTGKDVGWSVSFKKALQTIQSKYVLIIMEDYILRAKVNNADFTNAIQLMDENSFDCLRLYPSPPPTIRTGLKIGGGVSDWSN